MKKVALLGSIAGLMARVMPAMSFRSTPIRQPTRVETLPNGVRYARKVPVTAADHAALQRARLRRVRRAYVALGNAVETNAGMGTALVRSRQRVDWHGGEEITGEVMR